MFGPTSILFSCGKISRQACLTGIAALALSACGGGGGGSSGGPSAGASGPAAVSTTTTVDGTTTTTVDGTTTTTNAGAGSGGTTTTSAPTSSTTTADSSTTSTSSVTSSTVSSVTTTTTSSGGGAASGYYLYGAEDANDSSKFASLSLVAVSDFSTSLLTGTRVDIAKAIPTGTYDVATKTMTNIRPNIAVVAQNNQWLRSNLSGFTSQGSTQLTAFSAQAYGGTFGPLCNDLGIIGGTNLNQTFIVYETGGIDNNCAVTTDNRRFALNVMASSFAGGTEVTSLIASARASDFAVITEPTDTSQSPTHIVAVNGKNLIRYTVAFNNPFGAPATNIATAANTVKIYNENDRHPDGFFVNMDSNVYWYERTTNTLGNSLHTIPASTSFTSGACDTTDCYFHEFTQGAVTSRILRFPWKGTSGAQVVKDNIPQRIEQVVLSGASAFMVLRDSTTQPESLTLQSIPKAGGSLTTLDSSTYFSSLLIADKFIYYTKRAANVSAPFPTYPVGMNAVALDTSTSGSKATEKATWSGVITSSLSTGRSGLQADHLVLVSNISIDTAVGMGGATLQSYNAATNQMDRALGTISTDIQSLDFFGFANRIIGVGTVAGIKSQTDIVGLDVSQANSFNRITQTTEPEAVVSF